MGQIFDHFRDTELWLVCDYLSDVKVGNTDIEIVSYFGEESLGSSIVIKRGDLPAKAVTISIERLTV